MTDIFDVKLSRHAKRELRKVPLYIAVKLQAWIENISYEGWFETKKQPGYHDEHLKGKRFGQRSIRLSRSYRAIYKVLKYTEIEFIEIQEVNKHDY